MDACWHQLLFWGQALCAHYVLGDAFGQDHGCERPKEEHYHDLQDAAQLPSESYSNCTRNSGLDFISNFSSLSNVLK